VQIENGKNINPSAKQRIVDVWKSKDSKLWKVNYELNGEPFMVTVGEGGQASAGPYLAEIMKEVANRKELIVIPKDIINTDASPKMRFTDKNLYYVDFGVTAYNQIKKKFNIGVKEVTLKSSYTPTIRDQYLNEAVSSNRSTIVVGKLVQVNDGDTIKIKVEIGGVGTQNVVGQTISIRFAGIQAPETFKQDGGHKKDNYNYAQVFKVSEANVLVVADEAKAFVKTALEAETWVVVNLDIEEDQSLKVDDYNRYIGIIYLTGIKVDEDAFVDSLYGTNLNKTLIITESKKVDSVPLAIPYGTDNEFRMDFDGVKYNDYTKFDTILWNTQYTGPEEDSIAEQNEKKQREKEAVVKGIYDTHRSVMTIHEVEITGQQSLEEIIRKYNSSKEAMAKENNISVEDLEALFKPGSRAKDIVLKVPGVPTTKDNKVIIDTPDTYYGAPTNASGAATDNYIAIPAISRDESLGKYANPNKRPDTVRIGDSELTIPPLSIDVTSTPTIQKVQTLRSKASMMTKVGSNRTVITLQLFFSDLEGINGELIPGYGDDSYYINGLRPLIAQFKKAPFLPIENAYINEVYDIHSVALINLTVTTVPGFPHSLSATLTLAKFDHQAFLPQVPYFENAINYPLFRWYYQDVMKYRSPYRTYLAPLTGILRNDFMFQIADEDSLLKRQAANRQLDNVNSMPIIESKIASGDLLWGQFLADAGRFKKIQKQQTRYKKLKKAGELDFKVSGGPNSESLRRDKSLQAIYDGKKDETAFYLPPEVNGKDYGLFVIQLDAAPTRDAFPTSYRYALGKNRYAVPDNYAGLESIILGNAEKAKASIAAYANAYDKLKAAAEITEGDIPLIDWEIDGLLLTNINVMYENSFSSMQIQLTDSPTLQYLGGQDPYIQLKFHASTEAALMSLRAVFKKADEYAREYRYGITSGYLGFQNQLAALFGVTTVMLENLKVRTIPGQVNSYEVEMILCGFNKTQKRSETLEGFSSAGSTDKKDRLVEQDPLKDDALVFEEHIRKMEVYPDLELPTFGDLNNAISKMGDDAGITKYPSPNGGVFADPDFYVSTEWTMRELIRESTLKADMAFMDGENQIAYSSPTDTQQDMMKYTAEGQKILGEIQKKVSKASIGIENPANASSGYADSMSYGEAVGTNGAGIPSGASGAGGPADATVFTDTKSTPQRVWEQYKGTWSNVPSYDAWQSAFKGASFLKDTSQASYNSWKSSLGNPTPGAVYNEIYKWVDYYFKDVYLDDQKRLGEPSMQKYVYASIDDWYACAYNAKATATGIKARKAVGGLPQSVFNEFGGKMPRERIANYFKSIFALESGWMHFANGKTPKKNGGTSAMGMGQIMMSYHAYTKNQAIRLTWDWRYNLEYSVKYFYGFYSQAMKKGSIDYTARPFDWAVRGYNQGNIQSPIAIAYYTGHFIPKWKQFNSPAGKYASPSNSNDASISSSISGTGGNIIMTPIESNTGGVVVKVHSRAEMIKDMTPYLKHNGRIGVELRKKGDKKIRTYFKKVHGSDMLKDSETLDRGAFGGNMLLDGLNGSWGGDKKGTLDEIIQVILKKESYVLKFLNNKDLMTDEDISLTWKKVHEQLVLEKKITDDSPYSGHMAAYQSPKISQEKENMIQNDETVAEVEGIIDGIDGRLTHKATPTEVFQKSFTDVLDYDMRGRLIRAFPTFQLFIIDEGRWMSNYRLWDNFYGFNSIKSIDVHRSRKNAADTAVIEMTNMYSNLTTRGLDADYGEWNYNLWENLILGEPNQELLDARADLVTQMMLKTGARIHLRIGYSSNVANMPIVFNGTITEMDTQDLVTIVAQGDGIELTSVVSADPEDTNDGGVLGVVTEPRDLLCRLMAGKGNWFKNVLNKASDGKWFTEAPSGIYHFGAPAEIPAALLTPTALLWNSDYGEVSQNIYSYNGAETYSQWLWKSEEGESEEFAGFMPELKASAASKVEIRLYGKTTWDIAHDLSYALPDYITAVHSFGHRSTLFFGKPYYEVAYAYDLQYEKDLNTGELSVKVKGEKKKPFAQYHMYNSHTDIISNRIRTSEEGMYTNVIVSYDGGKQTDLIHADFDIRYDKQRTAVVESPIVARFPGLNFYTSAKQAMYYGCSTLRDYMKEMYKGELLVIGDPSVKPFDYIHIMDDMTTMNGVVQVESVTHHFSFETGFVTSIVPDAVCIIDDQLLTSKISWLGSAAIGVGATLGGKKLLTSSVTKFAGSAFGETLMKGGKWTGRQMIRYASMIPKDDDVMEFNKHLRTYLDGVDANDLKKSGDALAKMQKSIETLQKTADAAGDGRKAKTLKSALTVTKDIVDALEEANLTGKVIKTADAAKDIAGKVKLLKLATSATLVGAIAGVGFAFATNVVQEAYTRSKVHKQAVLVAPLQYQGREFSAGIIGHKGLVAGDKPGKWDNFYMGMGFDGSGEGASAFAGKAMNIFFDGDWITNLIVAGGNMGDGFEGEGWMSEAHSQQIFRGSVNLDRQKTYDEFTNKE
jgi:endonuclease YncB( thermonuclease family)